MISTAIVRLPKAHNSVDKLPEPIQGFLELLHGEVVLTRSLLSTLCHPVEEMPRFSSVWVGEAVQWNEPCAKEILHIVHGVRDVIRPVHNLSLDRRSVTDTKPPRPSPVEVTALRWVQAPLVPFLTAEPLNTVFERGVQCRASEVESQITKGRTRISTRCKLFCHDAERLHFPQTRLYDLCNGRQPIAEALSPLCVRMEDGPSRAPASRFHDIRVDATRGVDLILPMAFDDFFRKPSPNLGDLKSVSQAIVKDMALRRRDDLRDSGQPSESRGTEYPVTVPLSRRARLFLRR